MSIVCNVCDSLLSVPLYESADNCSITTMNKLVEGRTQVYFCDTCGHLQTTELPDLARYYAEEYEINSTSDEDDQLYKIVDGEMVYRADHQAAVLLQKIDFKDGQRVLDYGCAKSPTLKKIQQTRPKIQAFLFDVTDRYIPFWEKFPEKAEWSTHTPNPDWFGTMDVVLSFYALEHISELSQGLENIKLLLKVGGIFYFIVPNAYRNVADFVVADHVNHFSKGSLIRLLERHGFDDIEVDDESHDAAFVVKASLCATPKAQLTEIAMAHELHAAARSMADYWQRIIVRIREYENGLGGGAVAIYGAGFYGNFIASSLVRSDRIVCFVDRNKHLQGKELNGVPILSPKQMPHNVTHVFVGLNPQIAHTNIEAIQDWDKRWLSYFYL